MLVRVLLKCAFGVPHDGGCGRTQTILRLTTHVGGCRSFHGWKCVLRRSPPIEWAGALVPVRASRCGLVLVFRSFQLLRGGKRDRGADLTGVAGRIQEAVGSGLG
jgi:hypothetical protein